MFRDEHVINILQKQKSPVSEAFLIKELASLYSYPRFSRDIFSLHFSLFYSLYNLRKTLGMVRFYLHISPLYIRIIKMPGMSECSWYNEKQGNYCLEKVEKGSHMCRFHENIFRNFPEPDFLTDFYINIENINSDISVFEKISTGMRIYASRRKEVDEAAKLFSLTKPCMEKIKLRYHRLAMEFHPDKSGTSEKMMEINSAYNLLMEVYGGLD